VNKYSFRELFELQAQTKLGFTQVFHLKLHLEVTHCFLNVPGRPDDIQIIVHSQKGFTTISIILTQFSGLGRLQKLVGGLIAVAHGVCKSLSRARDGWACCRGAR
jgi:hypothetical protein